MNKQELIGKYKNLEGVWDAEGAELARRIFLQDLEQLDEQQKPVIPQFVAEIIEYYKKNNATLYDALREKNFNKQYSEWLLNEQNAYDKVARAWLDGYTVKKEKRYEVILRNAQSLKTVYRQGSDHFDFEMVYGTPENFTKKQLEDAGFGWVFDCEGVEVEEVE